MSGPQLLRFDFTFFTNENPIDSEKDFTGHKITNKIADLTGITAFCKERCSKWCFQLEKAPTTGKLHFQGRVLFLKKYRIRAETIKRPNKNPLPGAFWTPTSNKTNLENFDYVMKEDTRVEGPWTNIDEKPIQFIPKCVSDIKELLPWQQKLLDITEKYNDRTINILYSEKGGIGGSTFIHWMECNTRSICLPPCNDTEKLYQGVDSFFKQFGREAGKCFFVDLPKCIDQRKLEAMYAAIETIKGGFAWDLRHKWHHTRFDSPAIVIKTNTLPKRSWLSGDRWHVWTVIDNDLVPIELDDNQNMSLEDHKIAISKKIMTHIKTIGVSKSEALLDINSNVLDASDIDTLLDLDAQINEIIGVSPAESSGIPIPINTPKIKIIRRKL